MAPQKTPALELSTLIPDRLIVAIDGEKYEVRVTQDFGLLDQARIDKLRVPMSAYVDASKGKKVPSDKQIDDMSDTLISLVEMVVIDLPKAVSNKLNVTQRLEIVRLFMIGPPATPRPKKVNTKANPKKPRTTGASSPAAKGSTAATQKGG